MIFPLLKLNDKTLAFFNFGYDRLEFFDPDGKELRTVPIDFHHEVSAKSQNTRDLSAESPGWRWGTRILADKENGDMYTTFLMAGMVKIRRIEMETGKLVQGTVLPFLFPEKIIIFDGDAYFLCRDSMDGANWKLVKCSVR